MVHAQLLKHSMPDCTNQIEYLQDSNVKISKEIKEHLI